METLTVKSKKGSTAGIKAFGAHLVSWKPADGEELLFVSKQAVFKPPKAIRGGVPVCFPQFGKLGPLGQHGFARNTTFNKDGASDDSVTLSLTPTQQQLGEAGWAHPFELTIKVTIADDSLTQQMTAENTGDEAFDLTAALHTYFKVSDIAKVQVKGLQGIRMLDNTQNMAEVAPMDQALRIDGEFDRIFVDTPAQLQIEDHGAGHRIVIEKTGFPDAVVWNPWAEKAKGMGDFGDNEYTGMLCVEPALAASGPVSLQPGKTWSAQQVLRWQRLSQL